MTTTIKDIIKNRRPVPRQPIIKEIRQRWSPRFFSAKQIPLNHLKIIFEAARFTPSARNRQPWYFYIAKKGGDSYKKLFSSLYENNRLWAGSAPVLILACAEIKNEKGQNSFAFYDLGASVISLILQAQSLGYYARQMGLFDKDKIKKIMNLQENIEPFIIIALGKIGDYRKAPKAIVALDLDPRPRKKDVFKEI